MDDFGPTDAAKRLGLTQHPVPVWIAEFNGGFLKRGIVKMDVYQGKSHLNGWFGGYPYFRKPPIFSLRFFTSTKAHKESIVHVITVLTSSCVAFWMGFAYFI